MIINKKFTLASYQKKYKRCLDRLIFYSKNEIDKFDKKNDKYYVKGEYKSNNLDKFLLEDKNFVLIGDTYYEVPKRFSSTWFKNINKPTKALAALAVFTGITFAVLKGLNIYPYTPPTYSVSFDCDGGLLGGEEIKVINGQRVIEVAPRPKKEGYKVEGWYKTRIAKKNSEYEYKDPISFPYTLSGNTTIYCKWITADTEYININFDSNGGSKVNSIQVIKNSTLGDLEIPTKDNYKFVSWCFDKELKEPYERGYSFSKDTTLYAKWKQNAFTITFDTQGGSQPEGTKESSPGTYIMENVKSLDFEPTTTISRPNQNAFLGWTYKKDGKDYDVTYPFTPTSDVTLTAKWGDAKEFTVKFDVQGGVEIADLKCSHISTMPMTTKSNDNEEYKLLGWKKSPTDTELIKFDVAGGYLVTKDQTLYASWEISKYAVNLHYKDETGEKVETRSKVVTIDKMPIFYLKDHKLVNWYYTSDYSGYPVKFPYTAENDKLDLYAKYERNACTVQISSDSKIVTSYPSITNLNADLKPTDDQLKKTAYRISGFHVSNASGTLTVTFDGQSIYDTNLKNYIDNDILTIYVDWEKDAYDLTLVYNEKCAVKERVLTAQKTVSKSTLPIYELEDHKFVDWYYNEARTEKVEDTFTLTENKTLYAKYVQNKFSINLHYYAGDSKVEALSDKLEHVLEGSYKQNILPTPDSIVGDDGKTYVFKQWYKSDKTTPLGEEFSIEGDVTYCAKYVLPRTLSLYYKYTVDGVTSEKILYKQLDNQYNVNVDTLPHLDNPDYSFIKFVNKNGEEVTGTMTMDDIPGDELTAILQKDYFIVKLDAKGGTILKDKVEHIKSGDKINEKSVNNPTKNGYLFKGWYKEDECTNKWDFATDTVTNDLTLYAKWEKDPLQQPTTVEFIIKDADYEDGARFLDEKGSPIESKSIILNDRTEVGSKDFGNIHYDKHALSHWTDKVTGSEIQFPLNNPGASYKIEANFVNLAESCSLQLDANGGTFDVGGATTKVFAPEIDSTFGEFKSSKAAEIAVTLDSNHEFVQWEIYDPIKKTYSKVEDNYVFSSNVFFYARYQDKIEPIGTKSFAEANWATVIKVANEGGISGGVGGKKGLVEYYSDVATYYAEHNNSLLGLTKNVSIKDGETVSNYEVEVIGEEHDYTNKDDPANSKTALTFQFKKALITSSYAPSVKIQKAITNSWPTSIPRDKLTSNGEVGSMIDEQLMNGVKSVCKKTLKGGYDTDSGEYVYTQDKMFLLSAYELNFDPTIFNELVFIDAAYGKPGLEGTPYEIFTSEESRIRYNYDTKTKKDVAIDYWIRSPYNKGETAHWKGTKGMLNLCVTSAGKLPYSADSSEWYKKIYPDCPFGFVPAFAIGVGKSA